MAELGKIRIYVQYETLFLAEFQALLDDIEDAYNKADSFLKHTRRVRTDDRLHVSSVQTGGSIETILSGNLPTILALAYLAHLALKERLLFYQAEKAKWDAKLSEKKVRQNGVQGTAAAN